MVRANLSGLNLAVATPFRDDGSIDVGRYEGLLERVLDAGVEGLVLSSGTGMHVYLDPSESRDLIAHGSRIVGQRARVVAQVSALLLDDVIARTKHAADQGADAIMVLPPFFEGPTDDDDVFAFYEAVCGAGLPVIGYNVPQAVGVEITPRLFERLAALPNFAAVKDSSGDLAKQADLIRTGLPVLNGADPLMPYGLFAGASGVIWGGANFAPRSCVALVAAARAGQWAEVRLIWERLAPAMSLIWAGDYVQSVYAASEMTGFPLGAPRRPLSKLSQAKTAALRAAIDPLLSYES